MYLSVFHFFPKHLKRYKSNIDRESPSSEPIGFLVDFFLNRIYLIADIFNIES